MGLQQEVKKHYGVEIFQFKKYDIHADKMIQSRRWGTRKAIEELCGEVIEESRRTVDATALQSDIPGLTEIDYVP